MTSRFQIGQQYTTRGKHPRLCTVTDVMRTYNNANELVKISYVSNHEFMGQMIIERDVCDATIARGLVEKSNARLTHKDGNWMLSDAACSGQAGTPEGAYQAYKEARAESEAMS